jgi:hypothetical protein
MCTYSRSNIARQECILSNKLQKITYVLGFYTHIHTYPSASLEPKEAAETPRSYLRRTMKSSAFESSTPPETDGGADRRWRQDHHEILLRGLEPGTHHITHREVIRTAISPKK